MLIDRHSRLQYEVILFDADDTLFDFQQNETAAFLEICGQFEIDHERAEADLLPVYRKISSELWSYYYKHQISKQFLFIERFDLLFSHFKLQISSTDFNEKYLSCLAKQPHLISDAEKVCQKLHDFGCHLAIITNGAPDTHRQRLQQAPLGKFIQHVIASDENPTAETFRKPYPEIFSYAHRVIAPDLLHEKILMVGDSLESDIQGGINYGIDTCWFNRNSLINDTPWQPTHQIDQLIGLLSIAIRE